MNDTLLWYVTRGAGTVSLLLFTVVVVLGVVTTMRWQSPRWPKLVTSGLHRNVALASLVFLALHIVTAVVDPFTHLGFVAALVPFASYYRTFWLGLGVVALYLFVAVIVSSMLQKRVGYRLWRLIHWTSYAMWPIALLHGIGTGTDRTSTWMLFVVGLCVAAVIAAVLWRFWNDGPRAAALDGRAPHSASMNG